MRIYRHLDWLSVTIADQHNWRQFLPGLDWQLDGPGRHGYRKRFIDRKTGITAETDSPDPAMGTHITISGEPLAELKALDLATDDDLAAQVALWAAKCSRVDLTIDVWDCAFTPTMLANDLENKTAKIAARIWRLIAGHNKGVDGDTLDTGSATSDRRFRMYDKNAEKRIKDGVAWQRLELQLRRKYARRAIASCQLNGTDGTVTGHIGAYLHWQNEEYSTLLIAESVRPEPIQRSDGNRKRWLKSQVAKALAHEIHLEPEFRMEFDLMVDYWLDKVSQSDIS